MRECYNCVESFLIGCNICLADCLLNAAGGEHALPCGSFFGLPPHFSSAVRDTDSSVLISVICFWACDFDHLFDDGPCYSPSQRVSNLFCF